MREKKKKNYLVVIIIKSEDRGKNKISEEDLLYNV